MHLKLPGLLAVLLAMIFVPIEEVHAQSAEAVELIASLDLRASETASRDLPNWRKPVKIVVLTDSQQRIDWLAEVAPGVELVAAANSESILREISDAQVFLGFCLLSAIKAGTGLIWVQTMSAGVGRCTADNTLQERGVLLTNAQRLYGPAMSEHVIALLLALNRRFDLFIRQQAKARQDRVLEHGDAGTWELPGRTMLVVGLGGIGTEIARKANALGMRVIATRNSSRAGPDFVEYVGLADELMELVPQADAIVNVTPLTPATTALCDAAFFKAMKPTAYFINTGRGRSVVTDDLVEALKRGELAGAGLDVTDPEPLPADHELWTLPRVIITPHVSARSDKSGQRRWILVKENLRRYIAGEPMLSVVDLERGY
ncbi:MAG: D-2-hydroxyacid dehydrogenase [Gammaproteobacteria bacterium]|nr:D-2-hydroxyacid dehydrogenase [Gammaproteobacteria bacterium]